MVHCPSVQHNHSPLWNVLAVVGEVFACHVRRAQPEWVMAAFDLGYHGQMGRGVESSVIPL